MKICFPPWISVIPLAVALGAEAELKPPANLVAEGIPPVPASFVQSVKRYESYRRDLRSRLFRTPA